MFRPRPLLLFMKPSDSETKTRLQVFLSHSGACSRREAMKVIQQGRVTVDGEVICEPSFPVDSGNEILFNGKAVTAKNHAYVLLHKPKGFVTTLEDKHAKRIVLDLLPEKFKHLYPAGRLDKDTEGLLLLTNDGDVTYKLTHPKFNVNKTYAATIIGELKSADQASLEKGVLIEGKMTAPAKVRDIKCADGKTNFTMTIHEGRKRQIRLMLAAVGYKVIALKRLSQGPLRLGDLKLGHWRVLNKQEVTVLKAL